MYFLQMIEKLKGENTNFADMAKGAIGGVVCFSISEKRLNFIKGD